jgi:hypothetical protein
VVDTERIRLTASFRGLTPRPDSLGCSPADTADENAEPGDTGIPTDTDILSDTAIPSDTGIH